jgi:copper oxidase (laccase) domain-containing protein
MPEPRAGTRAIPGGVFRMRGPGSHSPPGVRIGSQSFPALAAIPGVVHAFLLRAPGVDVRADRGTAMARLAEAQRSALDGLGFQGMALARAEQVHSNHAALVDAAGESPAPGADALATVSPNIALGIHVADCAAVFFVDRHRRGIALAHSGRKGTELDTATRTLETLLQATGGGPGDIIAQISPCIRPPHYEVDFAAQIRTQLERAGVREIHDCMDCTFSDPGKYYSYRRESGRTGRLLAALALAPG